MEFSKQLELLDAESDSDNTIAAAIKMISALTPARTHSSGKIMFFCKKLTIGLLIVGQYFWWSILFAAPTIANYAAAV